MNDVDTANNADKVNNTVVSEVSDTVNDVDTADNTDTTNNEN